MLIHGENRISLRIRPLCGPMDTGSSFPPTSSSVRISLFSTFSRHLQSSTADFISDRLRQELDFETEASNATRLASFIASDPHLSRRVHIPVVYPEYTTKRVMTAEWIDGVRLSDRDGVMRIMGEGGKRLPKTASYLSLSPSDIAPSASGVTGSVFQGGNMSEGKGDIDELPLPLGLKKPLKGGVKELMQAMVELFGAQIFRWGFVHCDPHPGNVIIRPHPSYANEPQLVLLDHGLYVQLSENFRREYATLWKGLLAADLETVKEVTIGWGIGTPELFASATLMRPIRVRWRRTWTGDWHAWWSGRGKRPVNAQNPDDKVGESQEDFDEYKEGVGMKEKLKRFLTDTDKMPKELAFIGRNMRSARVLF